MSVCVRMHWNAKQIRYHLEFLSNRKPNVCVCCYYYCWSFSKRRINFFLSSFFNRYCRVFRSTNNHFVVWFVTFEWIFFYEKTNIGFFFSLAQSFIGRSMAYTKITEPKPTNNRKRERLLHLIERNLSHRMCRNVCLLKCVTPLLGMWLIHDLLDVRQK